MVTRAPAPQYPILVWLAARSPRQRRFAALVGLLIAVAWLIRLGAGWLLDRWWFDSVTDAQVWATKVGAQLGAAALAGLVAALIVVPAPLRALTIEPAPHNRPNRIVMRYRERVGPAHRWLFIGVAISLVVQSAGGGAGRWQDWVLFWRGPSLGVVAPEIGWDVGFHLFRLPLLTAIAPWLTTLILSGATLSALAAIANGALRLPGRGRSSAPRILGQLRWWAAAFALSQGAIYVVVTRPQLASNRVGPFDGPGWTELRLVAPSLLALAALAVVTAAVSIKSTRSGAWKPMAVAFGVWATLHIALLWVAPALAEALIVRPTEAERQLPYIQHNLDATRAAYALDFVDQLSLPLMDGLPIDAGQDDPTADVGPIPLFGEEQLVDALQVLQGTTATRITDVDLDRYTIAGERRPVMIAARGTVRADLPEHGWVQEHLVFTHGDGVVVIPADSTSPDGRPDVDELAGLQPARPQLYFGEGLAGWYAIVGTDRTEVGDVPFAADTGIYLDSALKRAVLSLAVGEVEPFLSAELTGESQLLYRRDIRERIHALAPFLALDANIYPVVVDDHVVWVTDGYTTSSSFPYAQLAPKAGLSPSSDLGRRPFNYLHASVKITVDAYDGTVHFYRTEVGGAVDPILDAWMQVFPGLIEPIDNLPAGIAEHLLYPPDLFTVQTAMLGRYHVSDAETLFNGSDSWAVSATAGAGVASNATGPAAAVSLFMPASEELGGRWVSIRPLSPGASGNPTSSRDELSALAVADNDDAERMVLIRIEPRPGRQVSSPQVAQSALDTDGDLAAQITLLNANGSAVQFGPMTPVPLHGGLVWVRTIVVTGTAGTTTPRLYAVVAVSNGLLGTGDSPAAAISSAG